MSTSGQVRVEMWLLGWLDRELTRARRGLYRYGLADHENTVGEIQALLDLWRSDLVWSIYEGAADGKGKIE